MFRFWLLSSRCRSFAALRTTLGYCRPERSEGPACLLFALAFLASPLDAQRHSDLDRAAELLASGQILAAESLLYQAARSRPRDPAVRLALGTHLAARGATRVGAVLLEEARFFKGDARAVAIELAPLYARLGDYRALATLPQSPLSVADRRRAEFLAGDTPAVTLADSTQVPLLAGPDGMGAILILIDRDTVLATIDPTTSGLVLDTLWARHPVTRLFGPSRDPRRASGVVRQVSAGAAVFRNMPARFTPMAAGRLTARIGLDVLAPFHPTFDERAALVTLRAKPPRVRPRGTSLSTMFTRATMLVATSDTAMAITSPVIRSMLEGRRWTWLARSGQIVIER